MENDRTAGFAESWDGHADRAQAAGQRWPGDEWGDPALWQAWFDRLLRRFGVADWRRAVEIGQGTGKYTRLVLAAGGAEILCVDVSQRFLDLCRERLAADVDGGRLHLQHIEAGEPHALRDAVAARGWQGTLDAVYSIDTFVHLSFSTVAAYLLAATEVLRPGGVFVASFADGTSGPSFEKLVRDIDRTVRTGDHPRTGCFHWISPELMRVTAERMGYTVEVCDTDPAHRRDGHFVGRFTDAAAAEAARALRDEGAQGPSYLL